MLLLKILFFLFSDNLLCYRPKMRILGWRGLPLVWIIKVDFHISLTAYYTQASICQFEKFQKRLS